MDDVLSTLFFPYNCLLDFCLTNKHTKINNTFVIDKNVNYTLLLTFLIINHN